MRQTAEKVSRASTQSEVVHYREPKNNVIPEFNPDETHQSVEVWLQKVEALKEANKWSELTTINFMTEKLKATQKIGMTR